MIINFENIIIPNQNRRDRMPGEALELTNLFISIDLVPSNYPSKYERPDPSRNAYLVVPALQASFPNFYFGEIPKDHWKHDFSNQFQRNLH